jgi:predicted DNA-binding protein YlxM (UPF0122 family)
MRKSYFTPEETESIIRMYTNEQIGMAKIGSLFNVSKSAIRTLLKTNNIMLDEPGQKYRGGKSATDKRYAAKHKKEIAEYNKNWQKENRAKLRNYHRGWRNVNKDYVRIYKRNAIKQRYHDDPMFRLNHNIRYGVWASLKERGIKKDGRTFEILGYSSDQLKQHLESQFQPNMSWENYGEWHVDHIKPISSFNFKSHKDPEFIQCWSLDNLQPLWGEENWSKGSKI